MSNLFKKQQVEQYELKRYRGFDQKLVYLRERRILRKILGKIGKKDTLVLDVPCGYGRFSLLLSDKSSSYYPEETEKKDKKE